MSASPFPDRDVFDLCSLNPRRSECEMANSLLDFSSLTLHTVGSTCIRAIFLLREPSQGIDPLNKSTSVTTLLTRAGSTVEAGEAPPSRSLLLLILRETPPYCHRIRRIQLFRPPDESTPRTQMAQWGGFCGQTRFRTERRVLQVRLFPFPLLTTCLPPGAMSRKTLNGGKFGRNTARRT